MKEPTKNALACRKWKEKNRERELERQRNRVYSEEERDYRRKKLREYHHENKDRLAAYRKEYYEKNKHILNNLPKPKALFKSAQARAKRKGLEFSIKVEDVVIPEFCPVFPHIQLSTENKTLLDNSATIDRIDSTKGYTKDNIRVISWRANNIKSFGTREEHELIAKYMKDNGA